MDNGDYPDRMIIYHYKDYRIIDHTEYFAVEKSGMHIASFKEEPAALQYVGWLLEEECGIV